MKSENNKTENNEIIVKFVRKQYFTQVYKKFLTPQQPIVQLQTGKKLKPKFQLKLDQMPPDVKQQAIKQLLKYGDQIYEETKEETKTKEKTKEETEMNIFYLTVNRKNDKNIDKLNEQIYNNLIQKIKNSKNNTTLIIKNFGSSTDLEATGFTLDRLKQIFKVCNGNIEKVIIEDLTCVNMSTYIKNNDKYLEQMRQNKGSPKHILDKNNDIFYLEPRKRTVINDIIDENNTLTLIEAVDKIFNESKYKLKLPKYIILGFADEFLQEIPGVFQAYSYNTNTGLKLRTQGQLFEDTIYHTDQDEDALIKYVNSLYDEVIGSLKKQDKDDFIKKFLSSDAYGIQTRRFNFSSPKNLCDFVYGKTKTK